MSWLIVRHAFQMVFGNIADALRVSVGPVLILAAIFFGVIRIFGLQADFFNEIQVNPDLAQRAFPAALILIVAYLLVFAWVAVAWHRFVLLEEYPGYLPALNGRPIVPYLVKTILLALVLMAIMLPLLLLLGLALGPVLMAAPLVGSILLGLFIGAVFSYFWLRFAICLPATAVGVPMKIGASWTASAPLSSTIFGVTLIITALNILATVIAEQLSGLSGALGTVANLAVTWVTMMVGVSILTTLYGHLVEGRELA